jgi:hypothetical protein
MHWFKDRRGQALVEMALILSLLLVMLMGIFDLGRAVYIYSDLCQTARELSRYGATQYPQNATLVRQQATRFSTLPLNVNTNVTVTFTTAPPLSVNVQVTYQYVPVTPIIAALVGQGGYQVVAKSAMLIE